MQPLICANCSIQIRWLPTVVNDRIYCCTGCAAGGPCECDYRHLPQPGDQTGLIRSPGPEKRPADQDETLQWQSPVRSEVPERLS